MRRRFAFLCLLAILLTTDAGGQTAQPAGPASAAGKLRVLFIGNSYTYFNDLPGLVERLSAAAGRPVEARSVVEPGASLERHWSVGLALRKIQQGGWDFVVLQEASGRSLTDRKGMFGHARAFDAEIRKQGGRTILFLTWAAQAQPETQAEITRAHEELARELGAQVAPVGPAWQKVVQRNPNMELYLPDGSHPSLAGSYLGACVFLAVFYGERPAKPLPPIGPLSPEAARYLQDVAWEAVSEQKE